MRASSQFADATAGVVYIHSSPAALCPHIEWALASALGAPAKLRWTAQPAASGQLRATSDWVGPVGTAARIAQSLRSWPVLRFEVTEDPSEGVDGERYSFVPTLGLWHGSTSANGDVTLGEMRLRVMLQTARELDKYSGYDLAAELDRALGTAWDTDLEVYRCGSEGAEVTWLRRDVG
ncbi:DUF3145 domain-containing protein [Nocardia cyriacigeorgica]|uniref:DUF3145 domain-containing protein n=1 Tax=Nocardia cyriacigeorgica TaxID=135487 RepID=A0ABX0CTV8_9NOCA|nr:DUF3145 domain-containing protein [Nocardia cyriacigeorgica]NEW40076.1 DUF3145 domain-containing protein [Nocardia cyriacigeorgica]NEW57735.1 DUF3145 domain-containing protein [Nocardia cyriacigeorgica]